MPKNVLVPQDYAGGLVPPVAEQSILFDRLRATKLDGFSPADSLSADLWENSCWVKTTGDFGFTRTLWEAFIDVNNFTRLEISGPGGGERIKFFAMVGGVLRATFETGRFIYDCAAYYHIDVQFSRTTGQLDLYLNGELYGDYGFGGVAPTIANVAGYAWMDSGANHNVGSDDSNTEGFSGDMADFYASAGAIQGVTAFGATNSVGTWTRIAPAFGANASDFYLTFGRTADLGEDFSGNGNHFPNHVNGAAAGGDQRDEWPERNYCTVDVTHHGTILGTIFEGGLVVAAFSNGRVTMQPPDGVWYYEKDGVAVVWDTGVSGRFNPLLFEGSYNFGQFPFNDVGPGGGELVLVSSNLTPSAVPHSRLGFFAGTYDGNAVSPRTVIEGDYGIIPHLPIFVQDIALAWVKSVTDGTVGHYQTDRLRIPGHVSINTIAAEDAALTNGFIQTFLTTAVSVIDGATNGNNVNGVGDVISLVLWASSKYAQNKLIIQMEDNAEEETLNPASGNTDVTSSDLELILEGADPEQEVGLRYQNVLIPQGATINSARIQFEADDTNAGANDLLIFTEDIDDAPVFVDGAANFNITLRTKVTPGISWVPAAWNVIQERAAPQLTPDFSARVQDVVDRIGWTAGNSLIVIIGKDPVGTVGEREAEAWNAVGGDADRNTAMLQVAWDNGTLDTGLSVFEYGGVGKAAQVMHGLDAVPEFFVVKRLDVAGDWRAYHSLIQSSLAAPEDGHITFNNDAAAVTSSSSWNNTAPGAEFLTLGNSTAVNAHEGEYAGWAMREIEGYSKLFRYLGNGSSLGDKIYCGFKPRMVVIKRVDAIGDWVFHHRGNKGFFTSVDGLYNQLSGNGYLNTTAIFANDDNIRVYANGFRIGDSTNEVNAVGGEYVGFAFAEVPYQTATAAR